jgi:hypothetical protein
MITRDLEEPGWAAGCAGAPPPLHVYDYQSVHANWHPLPRPGLSRNPAAVTLATVPQSRADLFGDDPTDPGAQTQPRMATAGMIAKLNIHAGGPNVTGSGVRR